MLFSPFSIIITSFCKKENRRIIIRLTIGTLLITTSFRFIQNRIILIISFIIRIIFFYYPRHGFAFFSLLNHLSWDGIRFSLTVLSLLVLIFINLWLTNQLVQNKLLRHLSLVLIIIVLISFFEKTFISFFFFFEISLIPIRLIILGWGYQPERLPARIAIIIYTIGGSLPLFLIFIYYSKEFYSIIWLPMSSLVPYTTNLWCLLLLLGFLVKFPIFTLHLWLPKAHVEAPVIGSIVLAAILLKLGGIGIWRVRILLRQNWLSQVIQIFSITGGALVAILCLRQTDIKILIAYSSVSHIRLRIAALLTFSFTGAIASLFIILAHGVSSSAMFAGANIIYTFSHSRNILFSNGLLSIMPSLRLFWCLCCLRNIAAPPSFNLVAEIWSIISIVSLRVPLVVSFRVRSFLGAAYSLILYASPNQNQKNFFSKKGLFLPPSYIIIILPHLFFFIETIIYI